MVKIEKNGDGYLKIFVLFWILNYSYGWIFKFLR